jgi:hypothetical protein
VMFSSDAVHNIHEHFPLRSHLYPPSYELSANTIRKRHAASSVFYILSRGSQTASHTPPERVLALTP